MRCMRCRSRYCVSTNPESITREREMPAGRTRGRKVLFIYSKGTDSNDLPSESVVDSHFGGNDKSKDVKD